MAAPKIRPKAVPAMVPGSLLLRYVNPQLMQNTIPGALPPPLTEPDISALLGSVAPIQIGSGNAPTPVPTLGPISLPDPGTALPSLDGMSSPYAPAPPSPYRTDYPTLPTPPDQLPVPGRDTPLDESRARQLLTVLSFLPLLGGQAGTRAYPQVAAQALQGVQEGSDRALGDAVRQWQLQTQTGEQDYTNQRQRFGDEVGRIDAFNRIIGQQEDDRRMAAEGVERAAVARERIKAGDRKTAIDSASKQLRDLYSLLANPRLPSDQQESVSRQIISLKKELSSKYDIGAEVETDTYALLDMDPAARARIAASIQNAKTMAGVRVQTTKMTTDTQKEIATKRITSAERIAAANRASNERLRGMGIQVQREGNVLRYNLGLAGIESREGMARERASVSSNSPEGKILGQMSARLNNIDTSLGRYEAQKNDAQDDLYSGTATDRQRAYDVINAADFNIIRLNEERDKVLSEMDRVRLKVLSKPASTTTSTSSSMPVPMPAGVNMRMNSDPGVPTAYKMPTPMYDGTVLPPLVPMPVPSRADIRERSTPRPSAPAPKKPASKKRGSGKPSRQAEIDRLMRQLTTGKRQ